MHFVDHLLLLVLAVVYPVSSTVHYKRLLRRVDAGYQVDRTKLYMETITGHWILFFATMGVWIWQDRDWPTLGFGLSMDFNFFIGAVLTVVAMVLMLWQVRHVANSDIAEIRELRQQLGKVELIVPRNSNELGHFYGLAVTAGIVEEALWRGYMIWYLSQFLPLWAAMLISSIAFGLGHSYQGIRNVPKITIVGALFAGLYVLTGSLWLPIVLHAALDMVQGRSTYDALRRCDDDDGAAANNSEAAGASAS